ncbi:MAG: HDIG domain-containing protein [Acidobacteriota bacterium]|nr:HDIG domain-containing protein [Acidobacteriota bacterium]
MEKKLLSLMPEFQFIDDLELQKRTINVWEEALREANWKVEDLLDIPFTLLIENTPFNLVTHTRAVTLCAMKIADVLIEEYKGKVVINRDYLISGALLHDVGKLFEYRKEGGKIIKSEGGKLLRHPISGAAFAYKYGIPQEVLHIIATHSREGNGVRNTVEAVIVNHSDFVNFESLKI